MKYIISPHSTTPPPGTAEGDRLRNQFISDILNICGDVRMLWLPGLTDTTTTTSAARDARVLTYSESIASFDTPGPLALGSGLYVTFNGTDEEADTPDTDNLSFGNGATDEPFSIIGWVNQTATATIKTILSKYDITTGNTKREWWLYLDAAEKLVMECYDDSASAKIGRTYNTALGTSAWLNLAATYDGSRANSGVKLYSAAAEIDDTDSSTGTYVAMENKASLARLAFSQGAAAGANFFSGSLACVVLVASQLSQDQLWQLKTKGNAYFGLTL